VHVGGARGCARGSARGVHVGLHVAVHVGVHVPLDRQDEDPDGVEPLCGSHQGPAERSVKKKFLIQINFFLHTYTIYLGV
jgi:hypothetical protein